MEHEHQKGRLRRWWWLIPLGLAAVLALAAGGGWLYFQSKLDRIQYVEGAQPLQDETISGTESGRVSDLTYFNILLLGTDERAEGGTIEDFGAELRSGARADACMLLSLNLQEHTAKLVSLERAIGVPIEGYGEDWLTHTFAYGGAQMTLEAVQQLTGIDVRRYARVNVGAAAELIDAIGGVDIELTEVEAAALNGEIYTNSTTRQRVHPGVNHLDGHDALAYARQRFIDDDFHRVQRQRNVLQAAIDQTKDLSLLEINDMLDIALPLVETNLSRQEISDLVLRAPGFLGVQLEQMTLPLSGMYGSKLTPDGRSMMMLDPEETSRILHEFFYTDDFDPATYEPSQEVTDRVWRAQQEAAYQWSLEHAQPEQPQQEPQPQQEEEPPALTREELESGYRRSQSGLMLPLTQEELEAGWQALEQAEEPSLPAMAQPEGETSPEEEAPLEEDPQAGGPRAQEEEPAREEPETDGEARAEAEETSPKRHTLPSRRQDTAPSQPQEERRSSSGLRLA